MADINDDDIRRLAQLLSEIDTLPADARDAHFETWRTKTGIVLADMFGETSAFRSRFGALLWANAGFDTGPEEGKARFAGSRDRARKILSEAIDTATFLQNRESSASRQPKGKPVPEARVNTKSTRLTDLSPIGVLRAAIEAVPAVRYALGVGGIAAIVAIVVVSWKLEIQFAIIGVLIVLIFMVVLVIFSALAGMNVPALTPLALCLAWAFLGLTVFVAALFVSCSFFDWPKTLPCLLRGECSSSMAIDRGHVVPETLPRASTANDLKPTPATAEPQTTRTSNDSKLHNCDPIILDRSNDTMGLPSNVFDGYGTSGMERRPEAGGMWTATGGGPFHVGWTFTVSCAGRYTLKVAYASEESRPSQVIVNNTLQLIALSHVTNTRAQPQWFVEGTVDLTEGVNRLRFDREQALPNIDAVKLEKQ